MQKRKTKKSIAIMAWTVGLLWAFVILSFSGEPAEVSREKSMMVTEKVRVVVEYLEERLNVEIVDKDSLHRHVRKTAHMLSYFVLGILLVLAFRATGIKGVRGYFVAWALAAGFSIVDEYYQTLVPGRGGKAGDVLLDNIGVLCALLLMSCLRRSVRYFRENFR